MASRGKGRATLNWGRYLESVIRYCDDRLQSVGYINTQGALIPLTAELHLLSEEDEEESPGRGRRERSSESDSAAGREKRIDVIDGLLQYAPQRVLLTGAPGSGKTTALYCLLGESAKLAQSDTGQPVPVLLELRGLSAACDHIQLLLDAFAHDHMPLKPKQLEALLAHEQLLLIIDGLNEVPDMARMEGLRRFVNGLPRTTSLVASTRDIQLGGNLDIERRMEMVPLSEKQAIEFVDQRLPAKGEQLVQSLRGHFRELLSTPLYLAMLCDFAARIARCAGARRPPNASPPHPPRWKIHLVN